MNSHVGKQFPLMSEKAEPDIIVETFCQIQFLTSLYGYYLPDLPFGSTMAMPGDQALYENPFNVGTSSFDLVSKLSVFDRLECLLTSVGYVFWCTLG